MKNILLITLLTLSLFGATPEQVDRYLAISNADEELIAMEFSLSMMQNSINNLSKDDNKTTYDLELLSIRFKEHIEKNLSEDEMNNIIDIYKNIILLQFVSAQSNTIQDDNRSKEYLISIKEDSKHSNRFSIIKDINKIFYSKDGMKLFFETTMKPFYKNSKNSKEIDDKGIKKLEEKFIKSKTSAALDNMIHTTKEFTQEELEELLILAKTPTINKEVMALFGANSYALKEFYLSLANRYDMKKH